MSQLSLKRVRIQYDHKVIIPDFNLTVEEGSLACLLGPSGCGKTTLLRAIAGFEPLSDGLIRLDDRVISSPSIHVPTEKRSIGMVFQDYALFPHLTIADNITFGLNKASRSVKQQRVAELLDLVNLPDYAKRYPHELSGGQQQRIALIRALAPRPQLLLLDEPFGSQDLELRETLALEVRNLLKQQGTTAILVTHDQHEAFAMADRIAVLRHGELQQWDSADQLYHHPANPFVAEFIGQGSLISGQVIGDSQVQTALGILSGQLPEQSAIHSPVNVLIRPEAVQLDASGPYKATLCAKAFRGSHSLYTLQLDNGEHIPALASSEQNAAINSTVAFQLNQAHLVIFKA